MPGSGCSARGGERNMSDRPVVVVATGNPGKLKEFRLALETLGFEVAGLDVLSAQIEVEETGETFAENARIKAGTYSTLTDAVVVADDSGLEVDALGGEPGVRSARYGGPGLDDDGRLRLVVEKLSDVDDPDRTGRFRCALAVARGGRILAEFDGTIEGRILPEPRGDNGFGYDPVFFHEPSGCTPAELSPEAKQQVSHRGEVIRKFVEAVRSGALKL